MSKKVKSIIVIVLLSLGVATIYPKNISINTKVFMKSTNLNGLKTINGNICYYNNGKKKENTWVNVGTNGLITSIHANGTTSRAYYFGNNGIALKGLQKVDGDIQYFNKKTAVMELDNLVIGNNKKVYLLNAVNGQGTLAKNIKYRNGVFSGNGIIKTNFGTYYINNGSIVKNKFLTINSNGAITNKKANGSNGFTYYFDSQGVMTTGTVNIKGIQYNFNSLGHLVSKSTSLIQINDDYGKIGDIVLNSLNNTMSYIKIGGSGEFAWQFPSKALQITLYNKTLKPLNSITVNGSNNENKFEKISNWKYKEGDIIGITGPQNNRYVKIINNGKVDNNVTISGLSSNFPTNYMIIGKNSIEAPVNMNINTYISGDNLIFSGQTLKNINMNVVINNKSFIIKSNDEGVINATLNIGKNLSLKTPIYATFSSSEGNEIVPILPQTFYPTAYKGNNNSIVLNMHRKAGINPDSFEAMKGLNVTWDSTEPLCIEVLKPGYITIDIKGNIKGSAYLSENDSVTSVNIGNIPLNKEIRVYIPKAGGLLLNIGSINSTIKQVNEPFNFKVDLNMGSTLYREVPTFDNRDYTSKVSNFATNNIQIFKNEIDNPANKNYGAVVIGNGIRFYVPDCWEFPSNFNPVSTIQMYENVIKIDNKLDGLDYNNSNQLYKPRTNFIYVTTYTTADNGGGWLLTGDSGIDTVPGSLGALTSPGWGVFHEIGHTFDPRWATDYMYNELYANMYTYNTQIKLQGASSWMLDGENKDTYQDWALTPYYQDFYSNKKSPYAFYAGTKVGLNYFYLLQNRYPDFMAKTMHLYTSLDGNPLFNSKEFLPYAFAKIYHINILPSLNIYGEYINDSNLYKYVIDNSTTTLNLVPNNPKFNAYANRTMPPTVLYKYNKKVQSVFVYGMEEPNAKITIKAQSKENKLYTTKCNSKGKFSINLSNIIPGAILNLTSLQDGKTISKEIIKTINTPLTNTSLNFTGTSHTDVYRATYTEQLLHMYFNLLNMELKFLPTITKSPYIYGVALYNKDGDLIKSSIVNKGENSEDLYKTLNNSNYKYGDVLAIYSQWNNNVALDENNSSQSCQGNFNNNIAYYKITPSGLETVGNIEESNKKYFPSSLKVAEPYSINLNTWNTKNTAVIKFNTNGIITSYGEHKWIGSNKSTAIKISLYNKEGSLLKSINASGEFFGANQQGYDLSDLINGTKFEYGDVISINYNNQISSKGYLTYTNNGETRKISNNSKFLITSQGLALINSHTKSSYKDAYFTNYGLVINGNVDSNISRVIKKNLIIKNNNQIVDTIPTVPVNWYSTNKENYSGYQAIITNKTLDKLLMNSKYHIYVEYSDNGKIQEMPIDYNSEMNKNNIGLSNDKEQMILLNKNTYNNPIVMDEYYEPYGYVINTKFDNNRLITKNTKVDLLVKINNQYEYISRGKNVNWYSFNKNNYNGSQFIITQKMMKNIGEKGELYLRIDKIYLPLKCLKSKDL